MQPVESFGFCWAFMQPYLWHEVQLFFGQGIMQRMQEVAVTTALDHHFQACRRSDMTCISKSIWHQVIVPRSCVCVRCLCLCACCVLRQPC
jgi:hypothetical protein